MKRSVSQRWGRKHANGEWIAQIDDDYSLYKAIFFVLHWPKNTVTRQRCCTCEKCWITGGTRPDRRRKDVFSINSLTSSTQFQLEKSFQTLFSDLRRHTIWTIELIDCVNCIIKTIASKNTAFFHSETRISTACSCSWQGVGITEATDLCSPPICT